MAVSNFGHLCLGALCAGDTHGLVKLLLDVHILALNPSVIHIHTLHTLCASSHPGLVSLLFMPSLFLICTIINLHAQPG